MIDSCDKKDVHDLLYVIDEAEVLQMQIVFCGNKGIMFFPQQRNVSLTTVSPGTTTDYIRACCEK